MEKLVCKMCGERAVLDTLKPGDTSSIFRIGCPKCEEWDVAQLIMKDKPTKEQFYQAQEIIVAKWERNWGKRVTATEQDIKTECAAEWFRRAL